MAGNQTDARRAADDRLAEAKRNGSDPATISRLQSARDVTRDAELAATGGNRQAGER